MREFVYRILRFVRLPSFFLKSSLNGTFQEAMAKLTALLMHWKELSFCNCQIIAQWPISFHDNIYSNSKKNSNPYQINIMNLGLILDRPNYFKNDAMVLTSTLLLICNNVEYLFGKPWTTLNRRMLLKSVEAPFVLSLYQSNPNFIAFIY